MRFFLKKFSNIYLLFEKNVAVQQLFISSKRPLHNIVAVLSKKVFSN